MKSSKQVQSMTGFASAQLALSAGVLTIELKSINSRFLDIYFKLADEHRQYEQQFRDIIQQHFQRGKIECRIQYQANTNATSLTVDHDLIAKLIDLTREIQQKQPSLTNLQMSDILRWPGVLVAPQNDPDTFTNQLMQTMTQACQELQAARNREGKRLSEILHEKVTQMLAITQKISPMMPQIIEQQQQKLKQRLNEALQHAGFSADNPEIIERVLQESTLFGIRVDIAEELERLQTHLAETQRIIDTGGSVGKRLDFMMQELNREANTLGSKASIIELSDASMQLKLLIEQMREQVQNLE